MSRWAGRFNAHPPRRTDAYFAERKGWIRGRVPRSRPKHRPIRATSQRWKGGLGEGDGWGGRRGSGGAAARSTVQVDASLVGGASGLGAAIDGRRDTQTGTTTAVFALVAVASVFARFAWASFEVAEFVLTGIARWTGSFVATVGGWRSGDTSPTQAGLTDVAVAGCGALDTRANARLSLAIEACGSRGASCFFAAIRCGRGADALASVAVFALATIACGGASGLSAASRPLAAGVDTGRSCGAVGIRAAVHRREDAGTSTVAAIVALGAAASRSTGGDGASARTAVGVGTDLVGGTSRLGAAVAYAKLGGTSALDAAFALVTIAVVGAGSGASSAQVVFVKTLGTSGASSGCTAVHRLGGCGTESAGASFALDAIAGRTALALDLGASFECACFVSTGRTCGALRWVVTAIHSRGGATASVVDTVLSSGTIASAEAGAFAQAALVLDIDALFTRRAACFVATVGGRVALDANARPTRRSLARLALRAIARDSTESRGLALAVGRASSDRRASCADAGAVAASGDHLLTKLSILSAGWRATIAIGATLRCTRFASVGGGVADRVALDASAPRALALGDIASEHLLDAVVSGVAADRTATIGIAATRDLFATRALTAAIDALGSGRTPRVFAAVHRRRRIGDTAIVETVLALGAIARRLALDRSGATDPVGSTERIGYNDTACGAALTRIIAEWLELDAVCSERLAGRGAALFGNLALGTRADAACSVGLNAGLACGASRLDAAIRGASAGRGDLAFTVDAGLALRAITVDFALAFKSTGSVVGVANARAFVDAVGADPALASGSDLATAIARLGTSRSSTVGIALARRCAARSFRSIGVGAFGVGRASRQSATIDRERVDHATAILTVLALGAVTRAFALDLRGAFVALSIGAIAHLTCGASVGLVATIDRDRLGLALAAVAGLDRRCNRKPFCRLVVAGKDRSRLFGFGSVGLSGSWRLRNSTSVGLFGYIGRWYRRSLRCNRMLCCKPHLHRHRFFVRRVRIRKLVPEDSRCARSNTLDCVSLYRNHRRIRDLACNHMNVCRFGGRHRRLACLRDRCRLGRQGSRLDRSNTQEPWWKRTSLRYILDLADNRSVWSKCRRIRVRSP